jgi:UDPglucose 6-dehydrogenase
MKALGDYLVFAKGRSQTGGFMQIGVVGLGYVGLVTAVGLAEWHHEVVGVERDPHRLRQLKEGRLPFYEPGLADVFERELAAKRLRFTADPADGIPSADIVMVAVGTHDGNGGWQTASVRRCLAELAPHVRDDAAVVVRSTLPPDFVSELEKIVRQQRLVHGRAPVNLLLNPEFSQEGRALDEFRDPKRIIIGVIHDPMGSGEAALRRAYDRADAPIITLPAVEASLAKLGANLFLATKISFANELAALCDAFGADVTNVVHSMSYDDRIGGTFLRAGIGFGGSCLPHQVSMMVRIAAQAGAPTPLLSAVDEINSRQRRAFVATIAELLGGTLQDTTVALLGLAFKPNTDDLRDAPALTIAELLIAAGARVQAYDPMERVRSDAAMAVPGMIVVDRIEDALRGVDAAALTTEWPEIIALDWRSVRGLMRRPIVIDGRNVLFPNEMAAAGFTFTAFGRGTSEARPRSAETRGADTTDSQEAVFATGSLRR